MKLEEFKKAIGKEFARYYDTEGCSCCQDEKGHEQAEKDIAELLNCPKYSDNSGYDWSKLDN